MKKFYLWLSGAGRGNLQPWEGEAATMREAIESAEKEYPGLRVTLGSGR